MKTKKVNIPKLKIFITVLVYSYIKDEYYVVLQQRSKKPYKDQYELPIYGLKNSSIEETLDVFEKEFGIKKEKLSQSNTFEYINNDLNIRNLFITYHAKIKDYTKIKIKTKNIIKFFNIIKLSNIAFNHKEIIEFHLKKD